MYFGYLWERTFYISYIPLSNQTIFSETKKNKDQQK